MPFGQFGVASFLGLVALQTGSQPSRWGLLLAISTFCVAAFNRINDIPGPMPVTMLMGYFIVIWELHMISLLVIEQHVLDVQPAFSRRSWLAAYKMLYNSRRVPTTVITAHAETKETDTKHKKRLDHAAIAANIIATEKQHTWYALRQLFRAGIYALVYSIYTHYGGTLLMALLGDGAAQLDLGQQTSLFRRLPQVNSTEITLRLFTMVEFVAVTWLINNFFHAALASLAIGLLRIDTPVEWPPLFGNILRDTSSLRKFWGRFWHRLVGPTLVSISSTLLRFLGAKKLGVKFSRMLTPGLVFLLSGLGHALLTWKQGFRCGWWEDVSWYAMNFAAILFEDVFHKLLLPSFSPAQRLISAMPMLTRVCGYAWTWGFLFWSLPKVQFAKVLCAPV